MRKHLVVALAGALSVTTVSASAARPSHELALASGDISQSVSEHVDGDVAHSPARASQHVAAGEHFLGVQVLPPAVQSWAAALHVEPFAAAAPRLDSPPAPAGPDGSGASASGDPAPPPLSIPLPVIAGPASPDGAPAPSTLSEAAAAGPVIQTGLATWYGPGFTGGVTYCGEIYDQWAMTAASNTLPCGTVIVVTNQSTGLSTRVRITDRGGFGGSVILDLSRAAFLAIASPSSGVIPVAVAIALP